MSNLIRWNPLVDMFALRSEIDRMFDETFLGAPGRWMQSNAWDLSIDLAESNDEYLVKASLPGINPDDLEISYSNNILTIQGEVQEEKESEKSRYHLRERRYGSFSRSISLPSTVNADKIDASYEAGVLTLHLPKVEEAKPHRIQVKKGKEHKLIEGRMKQIAAKN